MDQTWLKDNNFRPISGTIYLRNVKLTKAPHLDSHVNLTFENYNFQRCDVHGTIRISKDADQLWKSPDPEAVGRAIWVYSDMTWRSASSRLANGGMTYSSLKSACRELAGIIGEWEYVVGQADCEVLEVSKATTHKIDMIGVGNFDEPQT
ncbi:hypothetical protein [Paraburkholderia youngii]|uniref:hypothetical protein n=1 Tax=Paraburkholderia youngii TaxID=2782701 RepID=UPI003D209FEE